MLLTGLFALFNFLDRFETKNLTLGEKERNQRQKSNIRSIPVKNVSNLFVPIRICL